MDLSTNFIIEAPCIQYNKPNEVPNTFGEHDQLITQAVELDSNTFESIVPAGVFRNSQASRVFKIYATITLRVCYLFVFVCALNDLFDISFYCLHKWQLLQTWNKMCDIKVLELIIIVLTSFFMKLHYLLRLIS